MISLPELSGKWRIRYQNFDAPLSTGQQLLAADPSRWAIAFTSTSPGAFVSPYSVPTGWIGHGFRTTADIGTSWLTYRDVGPLVQLPWYFADTMGFAVLTAWEIIWEG